MPTLKITFGSNVKIIQTTQKQQKALLIEVYRKSLRDQSFVARTNYFGSNLLKSVELLVGGDLMDQLDRLGHGPFAENALNLWHRGFAVLPAHGKEPLVKGYYSRRSRYSEAAILNFGRKMPEANIAYQPGLSIPVGDEEFRLLIMDFDDLETANQIENLFGKTSGTWTSRGHHGIYKVHYTELDEVTRLVGAGGDLP